VSKELQALLKKAQSKKADDRYYAVVEIADLAEREAIQPLMAMANDPSDDVKLVVASTLGFLGERFNDNTPVPTLVEMFKNAGSNNDLKYRIIESLGMIGDPNVGRFLAEQLDAESGNTEILKELIVAIGKTKYRPAMNKILDYLSHDDEAVREASAIALGEIGDETCLDQLFVAADDVSSEVAGNAIISIGKVGSKFGDRRQVLEKLFAMLEREPRLPVNLEDAVRDAIDMIK